MKVIRVNRGGGDVVYVGKYRTNHQLGNINSLINECESQIENRRHQLKSHHIEMIRVGADRLAPMGLTAGNINSGNNSGESQTGEVQTQSTPHYLSLIHI